MNTQPTHRSFASRLKRPLSLLKSNAILTVFLMTGLLACSSDSSQSDSGSSNNGGQEGNGVSISGTITNYAADSVWLWELRGQDLYPAASAPAVKEAGTATFNMSFAPDQDGFYLIGANARNAATLVLSTSENVTISSNGANIGQTTQVTGSATHNSYQDLISNVQTNQQTMGSIIQQMRQAQMTSPDQVAVYEQQLTDAQNKLSAYLDGKEGEGGIVGKTASLYKFRVWGSDEDHKTTYTSETDYFSKAFFANSDLTDPDLGRSPVLFYKAMEFAQTMPRLPGGAGLIQSSIDSYISQTPAGSVTRKVMMMGFVFGLEQSKQEALYVAVGNDFLKQFPEQTGTSNQIRQKISSMSKLAIGSAPPPINLPTPEGQNFSLEQLKGKVVLVDFWASWCRPCRAENPNVVKMYNKYHEAGFDILSVSLDRQQAAWENAIKQDNMTWHHVSDLKFWQCQAAQDYNVSSIPQTFLLDREGNILAKNLRGPALGQKLSEIFGF